MSSNWGRYHLTAEFLSDAHLGSGSGGGGIDSLISRDRDDRPVIWASHIEGVLRDAARRLRGDKEAEKFFGRSGGDQQRGDQQRAVFTSLYAQEKPESHIWCSTARKGFDNRAPKDDTLRVIEYVPKNTRLVGEVELPASDAPTLQRLLHEVDALGGGRSTGAGRVRLSLAEITPASDVPTLQRLVHEVDALGGGRSTGAGRVRLSLAEITPATREKGAATGRLVLLLRNRDPLCITATATPDNLIPSLAFVPGRALLGSLAFWLIAEGDAATATLLTSGKVSVSDALPLPKTPKNFSGVEVLPAPLSLQSGKPTSPVVDIPWWAESTTPTQRIDAWSAAAEKKTQDREKLKRPEDDLFIYREGASDAWVSFRPARRVRLRNGRPDPKQADASLFAIEQIVEKTHFIAELHGSPEDLKKVAEKLAAVLEGRRWLRLGRAGAPVEVAQFTWSKAPAAATTTTDTALLILTSDLLVRDESLRWITKLSLEYHQVEIKALFGDAVQLGREVQDSVMVHGFNGTSRLWRMPAAAIRRGSVFKVSGTGIAKLMERAAKGEWIGERTHEGFGRFRIESVLPGVTNEDPTSSAPTPVADIAEEAIAAKSQKWFNTHKFLAKPSGSSDRKPSLSQWLDLVMDFERADAISDEENRNRAHEEALNSRFKPITAGGKSWKHTDAKGVLEDLYKIEASQRKLYARFFVRWLRAEMRKNMKEVR